MHSRALEMMENEIVLALRAAELHPDEIEALARALALHRGVLTPRCGPVSP